MRFIIFFILPIIVSCSLLTGLAMNAVTGSKGGINTELVVGDKEQVLGSNIEVKADAVGKVVGVNDNSVAAPGATTVNVTNISIPMWYVVLLSVACLLGWMLDRPGVMLTRFCKWRKNKWPSR